METEVLTRSLNFLKAVHQGLSALDDELATIPQNRQIRQGGRVNLDGLGDMEWLEQFRYVTIFVASSSMY